MNIQKQLSNGAGNWLMVAGVSLSAAQVVYFFIIDSTSIATTVNSPANLYYNILNMLGYTTLLIGLIGWALMPCFGVGKFAFLRFIIAFLGILLVIGDVWFESFAVPSSVNSAPDLLNKAPGISLIIGMMVTAVFFSLGWLLIGIYTIVSKSLPLWCGILLIIGALYSFFPLVFPHISILALAIIAVGYYLKRIYD